MNKKDKYPRFFRSKRRGDAFCKVKVRGGILYFKDKGFYKKWGTYSSNLTEERVDSYVKDGYWEEIDQEEIAFLL